MKQAIKGLFSILLLCSMTAQAATTSGRSFFLGGHLGSASPLFTDVHRDMMNNDGFSGDLSVYVQGGKNFDEEEIGKYLFFNGTDSMVVGTAATTSDVLNNFLLLGEAFVETVKAKPTVKNISATFDFHACLSDFMEGLHFDVSLPVVHTEWNMGLTRSGQTADTSIADGYLDATTGISSPYADVIAALKGDKTVGDVTSALSYHKVDGEQDTTKVGDVRIALGYNFYNKENAHISLGILGNFNGSGASDGVYWFEPNVGTAGRHGLGGRLCGHVNLYEKDEHMISAHLRADAFHAFDRTSRRTYDFTVATHGKGSRYLLLKEFSGTSYNSIIHQGPNITSLQAKIGMDVVYDVDLMLHYTNGSFCFDAGYAARGHSKEKHKEWVDTITAAKYGMWNLTTADADNDVVVTDISTNGLTLAGAAAATQSTFSSTYDVTEANLETDSGLAPSAVSHQVYGNLGYNWSDNEWMPFVGIGGGASFSGNDNNAFDLWNVHFTGGISF